MKIDIEDYKILCRDQQSLRTIQDYLEFLTIKGEESRISYNVLCVMANISDEVDELQREKEAGDGK